MLRNTVTDTSSDVIAAAPHALPGDDDLLTEKELALHLKINSRLPAHWRLQGTGPRYVRIGGRHVAYRWGDIRLYIAAQTFTSTSQETAQTA